MFNTTDGPQAEWVAGTCSHREETCLCWTPGDGDVLRLPQMKQVQRNVRILFFKQKVLELLSNNFKNRKNASTQCEHDNTQSSAAIRYKQCDVTRLAGSVFRGTAVETSNNANILTGSRNCGAKIFHKDADGLRNVCPLLSWTSIITKTCEIASGQSETCRQQCLLFKCIA